MLVSDTDKLIGTQFTKLPSDVRAMLLSSDFDRNIELIRSRHDIAPEKTPALENEIFLLAIGLSDPEELVKNISENVDVSEEEALVIIRDIDRFILTPVKNSLMQFFEGKTEPQSSETTPSASQNLPMVEPHLEPMIIEPGTPFLPPLRKMVQKINTPKNTPQQTPEATPPSVEPKTAPAPTQGREDLSKVNGALSAEIEKLLKEKSSIETVSRPTQSPIVPKQETPLNAHQEPFKPEDKLANIVPSKKIEVSVTKESSEKKTSGDPYREPIE